MNRKKEPYTVLSNIAFSLKTTWRTRKSLLMWGFTGTVMRIALPFTGILTSKIVIDELGARVSAGRFCTVVGGLTTLLILLNFLKTYTDQKIDYGFGVNSVFAFSYAECKKKISMDYELLEDGANKAIFDKANKMQSNHCAACNLPRDLSGIFENFFGLMLYGGLIFLVNPAIVVLLAISALINWIALSLARRYEKNTRDQRAKTGGKYRYLLAAPIVQNVSQREDTDRKKASECLRLAGLDDKIKALPGGMDTLLVRQVYDTAIELSGGEQQKLALARALYKDSPLIILDEPTAALDPIAENEMYRHYAELTRGKTSIYISHRLASTRFCDRILFLDKHGIAEEGTHEELMKKGGKYADMFSIQASYYKKDTQEEPHE
ncbi:MAG: ATP-binding cassette domain-containing protein [Treponema sp.]|jgi:ABC-type multidrug transport system fused ATPase/permease subunit|nr:ATP-binding cassette domain-containing protein [Treponema sp.]